jgi:predicted metal-dependent hydrolase
MAPEDILDYVIIHELVHLEIPNHSKAFWNRLEIIYPNFIEAKKWLRDNANLLKI